MTEISTILLSLGTTLGIPAAYFAILRYPDIFSEKVSAIAIFQKTYNSLVSDSNFIMTSCSGATHALSVAFDFCDGHSESNSKTEKEVVDLLMVELAKLQGYRGCNDLTNNFVAVAEDKVQRIVDDWVLGKRNARTIQIAIHALYSALQIHKRQSATKNTLYTYETQMRQASVETLNWTLHIAMFGLKVYLTSLALWLGYCLHSYGYWWRFVIPVVVVAFIAASLLLRRVANRSVDPPSKLLASLKEINA